MCENSHIGVLERCDRFPAFHALGEHRENLSRELLDFGIGRTRANIHCVSYELRAPGSEPFSSASFEAQLGALS
jgi:hypothetical protein